MGVDGGGGHGTAHADRQHFTKPQRKAGAGHCADGARITDPKREGLVCTCVCPWAKEDEIVCFDKVPVCDPVWGLLKTKSRPGPFFDCKEVALV